MLDFLRKDGTGLFASQTLTGHLVRGAVAFVLLYFAIGQQHEYPIAALAGGIAALVAMRGCPVCWAIGLLETVQRRVRRS
jgi:hypothetical protein